MLENQQHTAKYWIDKLNLQPHPEGGFYTELYRSKIEVSRSSAARVYNAGTSIYYLLEGTDFSSFHRLRSDEIWYFHQGAPLMIHMISRDGVYSSQELSDRPSGRLSFVVEAGVWFGADLPSGNDYTLVSCAVVPGFDFEEFELSYKESLLEEFPQHADILEKLCRF